MPMLTLRIRAREFHNWFLSMISDVYSRRPEDSKGLSDTIGKWLGPITALLWETSHVRLSVIHPSAGISRNLG